MTQEDKQLLLKDLCGRLPYGVKGVHRDRVHYLMNIDWGFGTPSIEVDGYDAWFSVDTFKPFLRPMSSMTEEELIQSEETMIRKYVDDCRYEYFDTFETFDWLNAHHFDYRGLIDKGLALEAPADMYKME